MQSIVRSPVSFAGVLPSVVYLSFSFVTSYHMFPCFLVVIYLVTGMFSLGQSLNLNGEATLDADYSRLAAAGSGGHGRSLPPVEYHP
jgi:hypothetical protein